MFDGDERIAAHFTLVPGSDFAADALTAVERAQSRTVPWQEACQRPFDLILTASPKGELARLHGPLALLPHGAGFGKAFPDEGTPELASGLDPAYLHPDGRALPDLHALAHPSQLSQLTVRGPTGPGRTTVVGDPTLERLLASRSHRDRYRTALRTGPRTLVALCSTWGPEALLRRRPGLPAALAHNLPYDAYQLALIVHPNERSRTTDSDLARQLSPAFDAGMLLAGSYAEWAALLVAADCVITDHGSTALYGAALGLPVIGAYDGGQELVPGSPIAELLAHSPPLPRAFGLHTFDPKGSPTPAAAGALTAPAESPDAPPSSTPDAPRPDAPGPLPADVLHGALTSARATVTRPFADAAFARQGQAMELLGAELYELLGLTPRGRPTARVLPEPAPPPRTPSAFAVLARHTGSGTVRVTRLPAGTDASGDHLAAEHGIASDRHAQSATLLYRRATHSTTATPSESQHPTDAPESRWTAGGWTARTLDQYPGCSTAAAILSRQHCVVRPRSGPLLSVYVETAADTDGRQVVRADPASVLSAVHAWLTNGSRGRTATEPAASAGRVQTNRTTTVGGVPTELTCVIGGRTFPTRLVRATAAEAAQTL